jgi:hypothetical protein
MKPLLLGFDANQRPIRLDPDQRRIHMHVIGASGSGKSKFLESMIRGDLRNRQGFCLLDPHGTLYNEVVAYCSHHVLSRDIIPLNLSSPDAIVGFNPFQKANLASVPVQVDRRIAATMHAWNVESTDQTPTLERTLRLIYTVMLDQNLALPEIQHLIDFNAADIRSHLVDRLQAPLIQKEWRELQQLKAKEWRQAIRSRKRTRASSVRYSSTSSLSAPAVGKKTPAAETPALITSTWTSFKTSSASILPTCSTRSGNLGCSLS